MFKRLCERWLKWKYRKYDDDLCCCGETMGEGGSICAHGGCRSATEYAITSELDKRFPRNASL